MPISEIQIIAAARAIDRMGLLERGWSEAEVESAFKNMPTASPISMRIARVALEAANNMRPN